MSELTKKTCVTQLIKNTNELIYSPVKCAKKQILARRGGNSASSIANCEEYFSNRSPLLSSFAKASLKKEEKLFKNI